MVQSCGLSQEALKEGMAGRLQTAVVVQHLCHQLLQKGLCVQLGNGVSKQPLPGCICKAPDCLLHELAPPRDRHAATQHPLS